jgi:hypothetical protein
MFIKIFYKEGEVKKTVGLFDQRISKESLSKKFKTLKKLVKKPLFLEMVERKEADKINLG